MAKWIIGQTNEWMSEWVNLDLLKWNSNETAAMHRKFLPLWQFHKLRHSTINKWRRYNRKCTCIVQKNKAHRVWERKSEKESGAERDRVMKAGRGRQATRQLQRVCQAAKSVANYAIQRGNSSPPPHLYSSLLPLPHARKNSSSSVLFPHCRGCLRQLRYTKAKSECQKAKSDGPNDMWKYANAKYQKWMNWVESGLRVCLGYGPQACGRSIRGSPCGAVRRGGWGRLVLPQLHFPLIKYNGPDTRRELSSTACFNYDVEIRINCQWKASRKDVGNSLLKYTL